MAVNDMNTDGKYCPIAGFNPPCGLCMWAVQNSLDSAICGIAAIAACRPNAIWVKNIVTNEFETEVVS